MRRRQQRFTIKHILIVFTIICIVMMIFTFESRSKITPVEKSFSYVIIPISNGVDVFGDWLSDRVEFLNNITDYEALNDSLQEQVDELRYTNTILEQNEEELNRLRALYELDQMYAEFPKTGASIIGKDPGNWYEIFIINKGENDGLAVNMVVMAGDGLVGHIIEVGPNYSKVQSIISDNHHVSAKSVRTSDQCIISGDLSLIDNNAYCYVDKISDEANIIVGDEIVTSNLSDIYPPGILIGYMTEMQDYEHKMTKTGVLEPVVDFMHLEEVLVIQQVFYEELDVD